MKRFYSVIATAIVMLVAMTASAQVKSVEKSIINATQAKGTLTRIGDAQKQTNSADFTKVKMQRSTSKKAELPQTSGPKKAPAKVDVAGDTWTSLGTGIYTEDFVTAIFSVDNIDLDVEVQESNEHPGVYRLVDPYKEYAEAFGGSYDNSTPHYMIIHTEDGNDAVWVEHFNTGFYPNEANGYGEFYIMSYPQYFAEDGQVASPAGAAEYGWCGTFNDGVITLGAGSTKNFFVQLLGYSTTNGWRAPANDAAKVVLPGVEVKDYSVALAAITCNADNAINFSLEAGADVAALKFGIYSGQVSASDANLAYVGANGDNIEAGEYSFTLADAPAGRYTILVAALDAAGAVVGGSSAYCYIIDDDVENWTSLGEGTWGENIIAGYYSSVATEDIKTEIQEHNQISGLYRLVNPYTNWSYAAANAHETDHNHYIYIHAENPAQVWIEDTPTGLDLGDGMVSICSIADDDENYAENYAEYWGTFNNGIITFPAQALLVAEAHYKNGNWYQTNNEGAFYVALPNYVAPVEDQIDFKNGDYAMSSGSSTDGDITEVKAFESQNGAFVMNVSPSTTNTPNRVWANGGKPQLRVYGGFIDVKAAEGMAIKNVVISGASGNWNKANYSVNGVAEADIAAAAEGNAVAAGKLTWNGNTTNLAIEVSAQVRIDNIAITLTVADEETTSYDLNLALAQKDLEKLEALQAELSAATMGNEEYIDADDNQAIETFLGDTYMIMINGAYTEATENGTYYASPIDWKHLQNIVKEIKANIEGRKNGTIALYTQNGIVGDATLNSNMPFYATPVDVEVYANQTVVVKGWDGVEGSDLKIAYTLRNTLEEGEDVEPQLVITGIEQTVNGEVVSEFVEDEENPELSYVSLVPAEGSDYAGVMVYPFNEMTTVLVGKEEETGMGQVSLYGVWAKMPVATEPAEGEDAEVDPGFGQTELETVEAAYIVSWPAEPIINGIVWNNIKTQIAQVEEAIANYEAIVATMMYASQYEGEEVTAGVDAARAWVAATTEAYKARFEEGSLTFEDGVMGEMMEQLMNVSESLNYAAMYDVNRYGAAVTNLWIGDEEDFEGVRDALVAQIDALNTPAQSAFNERVNNIDQAWNAIAEAVAAYTAYNEDAHAEIVALCEQTIAEIQALIAEVEEVANFLYTAEGKVGDGSDLDNSPLAGTKVDVEVNKNYVVLYGWDGTENSNLKVYYTSLTTLEESENAEPQLVITGIEQTVNGEVVSEFVEDEDDYENSYVLLYPQSDAYPMVAIYVANEMTGIKLDENKGQISLMGMWQPASNVGGEGDNMGVEEPVAAAYIVTWGDITNAINNVTANNAANGAIYNLAGQKVDAQYKGIVIVNGKKVLNK